MKLADAVSRTCAKDRLLSGSGFILGFLGLTASASRASETSPQTYEHGSAMRGCAWDDAASTPLHSSSTTWITIPEAFGRADPAAARFDSNVTLSGGQGALGWLLIPRSARGEIVHRDGHSFVGWHGGVAGPSQSGRESRKWPTVEQSLISSVERVESVMDSRMRGFRP